MCFFLSLTGLVEDDVHHNGFYTPELGDDEDCSSHASSSDWTPQPCIGMFIPNSNQIIMCFYFNASGNECYGSILLYIGQFNRYLFFC